MSYFQLLSEKWDKYPKLLTIYQMITLLFHFISFESQTKLN